MLESLDLPFIQKALAAILVLAVPAGILGTWIVLRGLAFYSHAVGTASYPGLVLATGLGISPPLGALGAAALFSLSASAARRDARLGTDSATALVLAAFLAIGVLLAGSAFPGTLATDQLLFGSLFAVGGTEIAMSAGVLVAVAIANVLLGARWLAAGFDPRHPYARAAERKSSHLVLLALIAITIAAILPILGALLAGALFVLPAATARLIAGRAGSMQVAAVMIAMLVGAGGVAVSVELNTTPGPTVAILSVLVFSLTAAIRAHSPRLARRAPVVRGASLVDPSAHWSLRERNADRLAARNRRDN